MKQLFQKFISVTLIIFIGFLSSGSYLLSDSDLCSCEVFENAEALEDACTCADQNEACTCNTSLTVIKLGSR